MTHVLAYAVDLADVRAVDISSTESVPLRLCASAGLLDDIDALRSELNTPSLLSAPALRELERFAAGWGRQLLPPQWLSDPPDSCVLVPHAFLHDLPLHLVRTDSGNPLCVETAVSISSSLTALRRALRRSDPDGLGWADPFFAVRADEMRAAVRSAAGRSPLDAKDAAYVPSGRRTLAAGVDALGSQDAEWRQLPKQLLQAFAAHDDLDEVTAPEQSLRNVVAKRLVGHRYELVVLAAHGYRNPLDALDCGLVLRAAEPPLGVILESICGRRTDDDDVPYLIPDLPNRDLAPELTSSRPAELLSIAELERKRAHLDCPLVILLGCSTGRPVSYAGDQPQSVAEVFLRVGAATVVAPMWDVRVPVVRDWTTEFLRELRGHSDRGRADAARRASRAMHQNGAPLQDVGCMVVHGDYR